MNLAHVVRDHADRSPDKDAILFDDESISYAALVAAIEAVAAWLKNAGVEARDRVGLCMAEHPLHLIAHFAVARLDAVILPMDHRWAAIEKRDTAATFGARVVVTDGEHIDGVPSLALDGQALDTDSRDLPPASNDDVDLLISLSSGTTGRPKGALLTHENFYQRFLSQWRTIGYGADDCFAILTPFYFGAGRSFGMSLLCAGGTVRIAPPPLTPPEIVSVLSDDTVTATFLPPTLLRRLFDLHAKGQPPLLANIRYLVVSGEPLHSGEALRCREAICPSIYSYYASSEGGGISVLTPDEIESYAASVGRPTYQTEVQIVDGDDNEVATGEIGRLRYRGPGVAVRQLGSDGSEQPSNADGWFYPGDLAEVLPSGHISLRGRDKEMIIRGGVNIYPTEIEATLLRLSDVSEAAVVGIQDADRGQIVRAFVVGEDLTGDALNRFCRENLAPYKIPQDFVILDELPKRSSGKIDKALLSRQER